MMVLIIIMTTGVTEPCASTVRGSGGGESRALPATLTGEGGRRGGGCGGREGGRDSGSDSLERRSSAETCALWKAAAPPADGEGTNSDAGSFWGGA